LSKKGKTAFSVVGVPLCRDLIYLQGLGSSSPPLFNMFKEKDACPFF